MTEEDKQTCIKLVKEMQRQAEPQLDTTGWQEVYDKMMSDLDKEPAGPLKAQLMQMPIKILDIISDYSDRKLGFREVVDYVEKTDAAQLDWAEVGKMMWGSFYCSRHCLFTKGLTVITIININLLNQTQYDKPRNRAGSKPYSENSYCS
jgi:hypothetical protein